MRIVKALNNYFFDDDSITIGDGLWFYGILLLLLIIGVSIWIIWINKIINKGWIIMIKRFKGVEGESSTFVQSKLYLKVEFLNSVGVDDPIIEVDIQNGRFEGLSLMDGSNHQHEYSLGEVEKLQIMMYIGKMPRNELENLMFGCA